MGLTRGSSAVRIGLIDGPILTALDDFADALLEQTAIGYPGTCSRPETVACRHGTFIAGMLVARRDSPAPAICPGCTLVLRPIFAEE
jgi:hypothetical protein